MNFKTNPENGYGYGAYNWGPGGPLFNGLPKYDCAGCGQGHAVTEEIGYSSECQFGTGNYNLNQYGKHFTRAIPGQNHLTSKCWWRGFNNILHPRDHMRRLRESDKIRVSGNGAPRYCRDLNGLWRTL